MINLWVFNRLQATIFSIAALWGLSGLLGYAVRPIDWIIVPLLATSTYQMNRLSDFEEDRFNDPDDAGLATQNRLSILMICYSTGAGALLIGLLFSNVVGIALIVALLLLGYLYSFPTIGRDPTLRLKDIFIGKNLAPAIGWAATVVLYPVVNIGIPLDPTFFLCLSTIFMGSFLLEIICDVRDIDGDRLANVQSIPVQLGLARTQQILTALNSASGLFVLAAVSFGFLAWPWIMFVLNSALVAGVTNLYFAKLARNRLISHALIFFQIILVCILGIIT